jgi:hypothetical protein
MNRGRHKKSKEKEFNTKAEILDTIQRELYVLLSIYESKSSYNMKDYLAKAWISNNDGRNYHSIVVWYINNTHYLNNFIGEVKIALDDATIKNSIYLIKFEFGHNTKIFKYKHE